MLLDGTLLQGSPPASGEEYGNECSLQSLAWCKGMRRVSRETARWALSSVAHLRDANALLLRSLLVVGRSFGPRCKQLDTSSRNCLHKDECRLLLADI